MNPRFLILLLFGLLGACARTPVIPVDNGAQLPERVELTEVPFFPQQDYQCGPAALATMLNQRGIDTAPEQLVERVYLPERKGSLQVEMVAAARAHGLLVYPLQPKLETLLTEVAAGNPVLVLQNLAFDRWPQWHFAVVVGYDLAEQQIILRSGTTRRWVGSFRQFERSWVKGNRWAVLTLESDHLPASAQETVWLAAASDLEQTGRVDTAQRAYQTAGEHWQSGLPWFALANNRYNAGERFAAEQALRTSLERDARFAPGWFNLSQVLAERGCAAAAADARACAARLAPSDERFAAAIPETSKVDGSCQAPPRCPAQ
ncbi:PA2778 family cysteine peptidase [Stutzerimonas nitrititolerans]|uniref:PA2778 family cysteine peptidase n=1 Tax=Stutzerimonas nitrititolerans TaxID=2482751 RepID=UPI0028B09711|nr:PA2778 family cysteine peptidase [Stutzerimonas nitrititolerans]